MIHARSVRAWWATGRARAERAVADGRWDDRTPRSSAGRWRRAGPAPDETFGYAAARQAAPDALASRLDVASRPERRIRTTVTHDPPWQGVAHSPTCDPGRGCRGFRAVTPGRGGRTLGS